MFPPGYFAPTYFTPRYFPPGFPEEEQRLPSIDGGADGALRAQIKREDDELLQFIANLVTKGFLD